MANSMERLGLCGCQRFLAAHAVREVGGRALECSQGDGGGVAGGSGGRGRSHPVHQELGLPKVQIFVATFKYDNLLAI